MEPVWEVVATESPLEFGVDCGLLPLKLFRFSLVGGEGIEVNMKPVKPFPLLLLFWSGLATSLVAHATSSSVSVEAALPTQAPGVLLKPLLPEVYIPNCRGIIWEFFDESERIYVPQEQEPCDATRPVEMLQQEGTFYSAPSAGSVQQVVRAVFVIGVGCRSDQPIALAECSELSTVIGPNISISPPQEN